MKYYFSFIIMNFLFWNSSTLTSQPTSGSNQTSISLSNPSGSPQPCPPTSERRIFWVHGLGGNHLTTWQTAGSDIQNRYCVRNTFPHYTETHLNSAGQNLLNLIKDAPPTGSEKEPFIIAHSQGGIVSRSALYQSEVINKQTAPFNGIVTFGTPHLGAEIIDNTDDIIQMIDEGCNELAAGPLTQLVESNFWLDLILNARGLIGVLPQTCDAISGIAKSSFSDFQANIGKDYRKYNPSEYYSEMHKHKSKIKKVAFYGIEEDPVFFRLLDWLKKSCEDAPLYSADYDEETKKEIEQLINKYYSEYLSAKSDYEKYDSRIRKIPLVNYLLYQNLRYEANLRKVNWSRGWNWLVNLNEKWEVIIGAKSYELTSIEDCNWCVCSKYDDEGELIDIVKSKSGSQVQCQEKESQMPGYKCVCRGSSQFQLVRNDVSDGVVVSRSAKGFPDAIIDLMPKSNHQQMRNDKNTKEKLDGLMAYGLYNSFFLTNTK